MTIDIDPEDAQYLAVAAERAGFRGEVDRFVSHLIAEHQRRHREQFNEEFHRGIEMLRAGWSGQSFDELAEQTRSESLVAAADGRKDNR